MTTRVSVLATFLALAAFPAANQPEAPEPRMVNLTVFAVDSKGQPVTDLRREELTLTENGQKREIAFFRRRLSPSAPARNPDPFELSNRDAGNVPRATVILFDFLNERFGTRGGAANRIVHDLQPLESADDVYFYCLTLDGRIFPVRPLLGPEGPSPDAGGAPWTRDIKSIMDRAMRATMQMRPPDDDDPTFRVMLTYRALDAVAAELQRVPGRKSLVWVTDGIPIELGANRSDTGMPVDFTPILRQMSDTFDRAGVSIYPSRQVMMGSPNGMGGPGTSGIGSIDTLDEFAELTGGRPNGGKDIGAILRQAVSDTKTNYQVAFLPPDSAWDGKFHKLKIVCSRKGVRIQAKSGYYAEPSGTRTEEAIASAVQARFDAAEIGLHGHLARSSGGNSVQLVANVDARDIVMTPQGDQFLVELRVAVAGLASGSAVGKPQVMTRDLLLSAAAREQALKDGFPFSQTLTLAPGLQQVRLIVFDRAGDSLGTLTLPLQP